jgi:outer membrane protein
MYKPQKLLLILLAANLKAEIHTLTLRDTVERASKQNPDIALARLDEQKFIEAVRIAKDPFSPRIFVGSGLAYSSGFPLSIEGAAPSVVQARASQYLFNRQQKYVIAQAREDARGAGIAVSAKRGEIAFRTASLFLDAERASRLSHTARKQVESLEKVEQTVRTRVEAGRELLLEQKRAALNLARSRQLVQTLEADQAFAEASLALVLGYAADDRVRPAEEDRPGPALPASEDAAVEAALESNKDLRRLESQLAAKGLEIRGERAARLPHIDLVAQYGLFARFNNYEDFFRKFQRHNGQLGISFQLPLLPGPGVRATVAQTEAEVAHLRLEFNSARNRIAVEVRQAFRDIRKAESAREVARLDLELAREQLSVNLALLNEGRILPRQVEESRFTENEKWIAFYDTQYTLERAQWTLLRQTGELSAALR